MPVTYYHTGTVHLLAIVLLLMFYPRRTYIEVQKKKVHPLRLVKAYKTKTGFPRGQILARLRTLIRL